MKAFYIFALIVTIAVPAWATTDSLRWGAYPIGQSLVDQTYERDSVRIRVSVSDPTTALKHLEHSLVIQDQPHVDWFQRLPTAQATVTARFAFDRPVHGLTFDLLDVDAEAGRYADSVSVRAYYQGVAKAVSLAPSFDNELVAPDVVVGRRNTPDERAEGNVTVRIAGALDSLVIVYGCSPQAEPLRAQAIGMGDWHWQYAPANDDDTPYVIREHITLTAEANAEGTQLTWEVTPERLEGHYDVRRRVADAAHFQTVHTVVATGAGLYTWQDADLSVPAAYYVRRVYDAADEAPLHSDTVEVPMVITQLADMSASMAALFPNPSRGWLQVSVPHVPAQLVLTDAHGRQCSEFILIQTSQRLTLSHLPAGAYQAHLSGAGFEYATRLILQR